MSFIDPGPPRTVQHRKQNLFITGGSAAPPPPVGFQIFYGFNEIPLAIASGALVYWGFVDNVRTYDSFQLVGVGGALDFYGIDDLITGDAGFIIL